MHTRTIWAIARKDALDLVMNKSTLVGLLTPILISLVWLLIAKVLGTTTTDILVYNPDGSGVAQVVTGAFPNQNVTQAGSPEQVVAAFPQGSTGKKAAYAVGLVIPAGFDESLRAGGHPQLQLYMDASKVSAPTRSLIQAAVVNYGRNLADPQPPVALSTTVVNPPAKSSAVVEIGQVYAPLALLLSLIVGITFMPQLLIEEKEKKTLRMLMVSPASFEDILLGKLLVVLFYQLILTGVMLAIQGAYTGQVAMVVLYAVVGGCFSLSLGLLIGAVFDTVSGAAAAEGPLILIFVLGGIFVGPLGQLLNPSPVTRLVRLLPTYYLAEGASNASQGIGTFGGNLVNIGIVLGCTIIMLLAAAWVLRRQSAVAAMI